MVTMEFEPSAFLLGQIGQENIDALMDYLEQELGSCGQVIITGIEQSGENFMVLSIEIDENLVPETEVPAEALAEGGDEYYSAIVPQVPYRPRTTVVLTKSGDGKGWIFKTQKPGARFL